MILQIQLHSVPFLHGVCHNMYVCVYVKHMDTCHDPLPFARNIRIRSQTRGVHGAPTWTMVDVIKEFRYKTAGRGRGILGITDLGKCRRPLCSPVKPGGETASSDRPGPASAPVGHDGATKREEPEAAAQGDVSSWCMCACVTLLRRNMIVRPIHVDVVIIHRTAIILNSLHDFLYIPLCSSSVKAGCGSV